MRKQKKKRGGGRGRIVINGRKNGRNSEHLDFKKRKQWLANNVSFGYYRTLDLKNNTRKRSKVGTPFGKLSTQVIGVISLRKNKQCSFPRGKRFRETRQEERVKNFSFKAWAAERTQDLVRPNACFQDDASLHQGDPFEFGAGVCLAGEPSIHTAH